jgi:hypothetical protein
MKKQLAFIIVYNHQYNKNIEILETIYSQRFSHIYHLVPFYSGGKSNVIPVYENSYYFQGYIAQGLKSYFDENFVHYMFIADDLLLHPDINETNYREFFKLGEQTCFVLNFEEFHTQKKWWPMVGSYSDLLIVSADVIKPFCQYCGVFAATWLFVEIALPTAMVLSTFDIVTEKDLDLQAILLWIEKDFKRFDHYNYQLKKLLKDFPENTLYIHPIKLSKWNTTL